MRIADRYESLAALGAGGMGRVHLVRDAITGEELALKTLDGPVTPETRARFEQEYLAMRALAHPNLVQVFSFGLQADEVPYFTMEALAGTDLASRVPIGPEELLAILPPLSRALDHIHARGLVHGDVTAANVWLTPDGGVKLLDLGLLTPAGTAWREPSGTLSAMAPEVLRGERIDRRADLYGLGVLAYQALTGCPPFQGDSVLAMLRSHLEAIPPAPGALVPGIPPALDRAIMRLLAKARSERPSSASELLSDLGMASPPTPGFLTPPMVGRQSERTALMEALSTVRATRRPALAVLQGPEGVGKSRLAEEISIQSQLLPAACAVGQCHRDGGLFAPFGELLRELAQVARQHRPDALSRAIPLLAGLVPEWAAELMSDPLDPRQERARTQRALLEFIGEISEGGLLLVLEDWQWADPGSQDLLAYLRRNLREVPVLVILTSRDPMDGLVPDHVLGLAPLNRQETAEIAAEILGGMVGCAFAERLHAQTGGSPAAIEEALRHLVEGGRLVRGADGWDIPRDTASVIPTERREWLAARLQTLSAGALPVARAAALVGHPFSPGFMLEALGPEALQGLTELEAAGLLHRTVRRDGVEALTLYGPIAGLLQEWLLGEDGRAERERLLANLAAALEDQAHADRLLGDRETLADLARYYAGCGRQEKVAIYALEAAELHNQVFAASRAHALIAQGLSALAALRSEGESGLEHLALRYHVAQGDAHRHEGRAAEAEAAYRTALGQLDDDEDRLLARILTNLGLAIQMGGRHAEARSVLSDALLVCNRTGESHEKLRCLTSLARVTFQAGDLPSAMEIAEEALEFARAVGDLVFQGESLGLLGLLRVNTGSPRDGGRAAKRRDQREQPDAQDDRPAEDGLALLRESIAIHRATGDHLALNDSLMLLGNAQLALGRHAEAVATFTENFDLCEELGTTDDGLVARTNLAQVLLELGRWEDAAAWATGARDGALAVENRFLAGHAQCLLALARLQGGRLSGLREQVDGTIALGRQLDQRYLEIEALACGAEVDLGLGRLMGALDRAKAAFTLCTDWDAPEFEPRINWLLGRTYFALGDFQLAEESLQIAREQGLERQAEGMLSRILLSLATLRLKQFNLPAAGSLLDQAAELAQRCAQAPVAEEIRIRQGEVLQATGDVRSAEARFASALAAAETAGYPLLATLAAYGCAQTAEALPAVQRAMARARQQLTGLLDQLDPVGQEYLAGHDPFRLIRLDKIADSQLLGLEALRQVGDISFNRVVELVLESVGRTGHRDGTMASHGEILATFSKSIHGSLQLEQVLDQIIDQVMAITRADRGYLMLLDEAGNLASQVVRSREAERARLAEFSHTFTDLVLAEGKPVWVADAQSDVRFAQAKSVLSLELRTVICVPLKIEEHVIGLIYVDKRAVNSSFSAKDLSLMEALAGYASIALANARLFTRTEERSTTLQLLNELSQAVATTTSLEALLEVTLAHCLRVSGAEQGCVLLGAKDAMLLGRDRDGHPCEVVPSTTVVEAARASGAPLCVLDTGQDAVLSTQESIVARALRSVMAIPLRTPQRLIGIVYLESPVALRQFQQKDLALMAALCAQSALAAENIQLIELMNQQIHLMEEALAKYEEAQKKAVTDGLTGLVNHAHFQEQLARAVAEARRYGRSLSLLMLDLDDFKAINDTHGHPVGDEVLRRVAQVLRENVRDADLAARYGGEELVMMLPDTDQNGALVLAERIRQRITELTIPDAQGNPIPSVTASIGLSELVGPQDASVQLLQRADQALYAAKHGGKNRVCRHGEPVPPAVGVVRAQQKLQQDATFQSFRALSATLSDRHATARNRARAGYIEDLARRVGLALMLPAEKQELLEMASALHDIGKLGIPEEVLQKPGPLSEQEWEHIRNHPQVGHKLLKAGNLGALCEAILRHHERWDGKGYPGRLSGTQIPLLARVVSLLDAFEAMITDRPYRPSLSLDQAVSELEKGAGRQFDPDLVAILTRLIRERPPAP